MATASSQAPIRFSDYFRLLRGNRNFRLLWLAQVISELGDWIYVVALYDLLYRFTGKAESIGIAFVLQVLPQCLAAPASGVLNDRLSRKQVMIATDLFRALIIGAMVFVQTPQLVWLLYVLLFLETIMWGTFEPARSAIIPNITHGDETAVANSLSSITWSSNFMMGFAVGGLLTAWLGATGIFVFDAASFLLSAALLARMRFHEPHLEGQPPLRFREFFDFRPLAEGLRYVKQDRRLLATVFVKAGNSVIASNWVLLTIYGRQLAEASTALGGTLGGILGMSSLMAFRGMGAIAGPLLATRWAGRDQARQRRAIQVGFAVACFGYLLLSQANTLLTAAAAVFIAHGGSSITWVFSSTLLQVNTEDRLRGRVFSAEFAAAVVVMSMSSASAGWLLDHGWSPSRVAFITGLALLLPLLAWTWALRFWRRQPA